MFEAEKQVARRLYEEVWNQGRVDSLDGFCTETGATHDPLMGDIAGPQGYAMYVAGFRTAFPDIRFTIQHMVAEESFLAVHWSATGTQTGPLLGVEATGKSGTITGITLMRFEDGKIAESWIARDDLKLFQELGMAQTLAVPAQV